MALTKGSAQMMEPELGDASERDVGVGADQVPTNSMLAQSGANFGKNLIINGDFSVWQRATSQTTSGYGSDDRWRNDHNGSTKTVSRQAYTVGLTSNPTPATKHYSRTVVTSVAGAANYVRKTTRLEDNTRFGGREVTLSFWAKADASKNIATGYVQDFGSGGSPSASETGIGITTHNLTTSWQEFTVTTTIPSIQAKTLGTNNDDFLMLEFWFDAGSGSDARTNSLGQQSGTFDIANVQLEFGGTATEFEYVPPADQLARCQRYYYQIIYRGQGYLYNVAGTDALLHNVPLPVNMRADPAFTLVTSPSFNNCSTINFQGNSQMLETRITVTSTGAYRATNAEYSADAEL